MKKKNSKSKLKRQPQKFDCDQILAGIILLTLIIVPLLVRLVEIEHASPIISLSVLDTGAKYQFFSYYKFIGLIIGTMSALGVFIYKIVRKGYRIKVDYTSLPVALFFFFILISGVMAQYKTISLIGHYNRHQGTITYLCYLILFFIAANTHYSKRIKGLFSTALYPLVIINFFLGILYFYGVNVFNWSIVDFLLFPSSLPSNGLGANSILDSTFGNRDYLSGFGGIMASFFLTRAILDKDYKNKITNLIFALLSFTTMLCAFATSGFLTFVIIFIGLIVISLLGKERRKKLITITSAIILFAMSFGVLNSHNNTVWQKTIGYLIKRNNVAVVQSASSGKITTSALIIKRPTKTRDKFGLPVSSAESGSGRFYIWRKTFELIKAKPIIGYGLDTLGYYFPQDDSEKISGIGGMDLIVDKPHNMYLGIAFGSGILSLLAFGWLLLNHFWKNLKFFRKSPNNEGVAVLASLFAAWCGYLIQALFNDSIMGTAPVFWILFGVGVSLLKDEAQATN